MKNSQIRDCKLVVMYVAIILLIAYLILQVGTANAQLQPAIDMGAIAYIESKGNPFAYNSSSSARGIFQITEICLKDWNAYHPRDKYTPKDLFRSDANIKIATWYLSERIPQLLRHYGLEVNLENILISYNFGIGNLVKGKKLPEETINYIRDFKELTE